MELYGNLFRDADSILEEEGDSASSDRGVRVALTGVARVSGQRHVPGSAPGTNSKEAEV